jgi:hypothetical protein
VSSRIDPSKAPHSVHLSRWERSNFERSEKFG